METVEERIMEISQHIVAIKRLIKNTYVPLRSGGNVEIIQEIDRETARQINIRIMLIRYDWSTISEYAIQDVFTFQELRTIERCAALRYRNG